MVFARSKVDGEWMWGEHRLPRVGSYSYLGVEFACNAAWDMHVNNSDRKRLNQLHSL